MKNSAFAFSPELLKLAGEAEEELGGRFAEVDRVSMENTARVMDAFRRNRVSETYFPGTTGYGYNDNGREALDRIYAEVFGTEDALVRIGFVNGTHAITSALFSALRPGDVLLSATGTPYDTLRSVIGLAGDYPGSLRYYGIGYEQTDMTPSGEPDLKAIRSAAANPSVKAVEVQRSRGYSGRPALTISRIADICDAVHKGNPDAVVIVDNCYGEFTETCEPTAAGADLAAGSLIKNPGGGLAQTGGYVAGRADLVSAAAMRLTAPGTGGECGATLGQNRFLYQGLFLAPHTVAQALKTAVFCAAVMERLGYRTYPGALEQRDDIVQVVELGNPELLRRFCRGIQAGAPVDAFLTPEPWDMPGYEDKVIMAAGAFVQGASIELSADGPMRPPYRAYLQGGLTYESGKIGVLSAAQMLSDEC